MRKVSKICSNAFIVIILMMMAKPHLPMSSSFFKTLYLPINKIEGSIGTNQTWMMFAPNPSKLDAYVIGEVFYADGSSWTYDFNTGTGINIFQKYLYGEKYRKFTSEHLRTDRRRFLWEDGARFAVKKLEEKHPGKVAIKVSLTRYWSETPHWRKFFIKHGEDKPTYHRYQFYTKEGL